MKVICLVSGGKDSVFSLWLALHQFNVVSILTVKSCPESYLFHLPNCNHVVLIAEMLGLPHCLIQIESCNIEDEINALKDFFIESDADAVITGGIQSEFQRFKFNRAAQLANMICLNPLWRLSPETLMTELINNKFHIIIVSVAAMGLGKNLLGKRITNNLLEEFQGNSIHQRLSITGEGGEYESFVLDAPFFPHRIKILESKILWDEHRDEGYYEIIKAELCPKR
jgi:ABC transporter with metal-binding/Fe-S-binding domain ATP-binding protein